MSELLTDKVASRYYEFAVHLGLDPHTVDVIQNDHFNKCHRCLIAVLNAYIHNYDVSWKTVCIALEHIELKNMAKQISSKYLYLEQ